MIYHIEESMHRLCANTSSSYRRDVSSHGLWYPQEVLEQISHRYWEMIVHSNSSCNIIAPFLHTQSLVNAIDQRGQVWADDPSPQLSLHSFSLIFAMFSHSCFQAASS
jgi:hypothetical protein